MAPPESIMNPSTTPSIGQIRDILLNKLELPYDMMWCVLDAGRSIDG
jgi:hypothetical protein